MNLDDRYIREVSISSSESNQYPYNIPSIRNFGTLKLDEKVTYIIGDNGSGKSTILEALASCLGINPEGGNRNTNFSNFSTESTLHENMKLVKGLRRIEDGFFFRSETMYNLFSQAELEKQNEGRFGWNVYGWSGRHDASHGEGHLEVIKDKMHNGFYLFDEPEAALSPDRQLSLLSILHDLILNGSQIIISTHSPIVLAYPNSTIYTLNNGSPQQIEYEEAECVLTYEMFMKRRKMIVGELVNDE